MERHTILGFVLLFLLLLGIAQLGLCGICIESEKQALLKFKASIYDYPYKNLSSWNPKTNCCQWDGIACHNVTGHILKLDLSYYSLQATGVDPSLLELQHLIYLDLSGNNFNAISIPAFLGSMGRLRYLSISESNFTGKIPTNLGRNLTALQFLDLSYNDLHIKDMSWISKIQSLQHLDLSRVYLGEAHNLFQVLHMLPSLSQLQLEECGLGNLSAPLSPFNFTNNTRVQVLNLAKNEIDGRILHVFQNWTFVESLDLHVNNLSSMPLWLGEFKNLVSLDLSINALCGPIPVALSNLTSLEYLDLSANNFSSVPSWLGELRSLRHLDISRNQVTATVEISVSQLLKNMCHLQILYLYSSNLQGQVLGDSDLSGCIKYDIEELDLSRNGLNGHLPTWIGHLEKLVYLDLSNNYICGNIPHSFGQLVNLRSLYLSSNSLSGLIPQNIGQLVNLTYLSLFNNSLSDNSLMGNIPQSLGQLSNLLHLDLSDNSLMGNIPQSLSQLSNLLHLDLSDNSLMGNIPQSLGQLSNLYDLDLSNNSFSGNIPQSFCHLVNLSSIDLSHDNLSGEIPNCWRDTSQLREIKFSFNKLSGTFPISIGKLSSLFWLHLNNNCLEGKLPLNLENMTQLRILDLGENNIFGSVPPWTSNTFPTLIILRLRDNMLDGNIPLHLCQLQSLHILDLANNNLSGSIPHCIGNLTGMTINSTRIWISTEWNIDAEVQWPNQHVKQVMKGREFDIIGILQLEINFDLSNNNLVGSIPIELFSLVKLISLNLSHNHLKGEIPEIIGDMKSLESFDISHNQIFGTIPRSISKVTTLNHLNMSYNNLSGPIPTENQFLTMNDPSIYVGNPYLCGIPLPNKCQDDDPHQVPETREHEDEHDPEKVWFYFVVAIGFAVGFWGAIGTLVLKKSWRYACFRRVEDVADEIYVYTSIKMAKLKRLLTTHVHG
ncbi:receptor-like protein EIX2 [Neltuma alba]|uniref:receptor-like protein EIX2 n=1 Tax=Neltuma alba TaxID=207710 RepID=UPI0010A4255D|nr:receptor-like protein EIX2 [Prosopis alba]